MSAVTASPANRTAITSDPSSPAMPTGGSRKAGAPAQAHASDQDDRKYNGTATAPNEQTPRMHAVAAKMDVRLPSEENDPEPDLTSILALDAAARDPRNKRKPLEDLVFSSALSTRLDKFDTTQGAIHRNVLNVGKFLSETRASLETSSERAAKAVEGLPESMQKEHIKVRQILEHDLAQERRARGCWKCCAITTFLVSTVALAVICLTHYPKKLARPLLDAACNGVYDICSQFPGNKIFATLKKDPPTT